MFRSKRRRAALIVTALVAVSTGASFAVASIRDDKPGHVPPPSLLAPVGGHIPLLPGAPDDVLSTLASRFPLVSNVQVETTQAPQEENPAETTDVRTITYDLAVDSAVGSDATEAVWQGDLLVGAITDEFLARGFERVPLARATLVTPDGRRHPLGGGIGNVARGQVFYAIPAGLAETVAERAEHIGLRDVGVTTVRALQNAIEIVGTASDPATAITSFTRAGGLAGLLGVDPAVFEGVLLRINDVSGKAVLFAGQASRDGSWLRWADPVLAKGQ